jgi:hypothetical protein
MNCPWCGSEMLARGNEWVCVANGPFISEGACPLSGELMTSDDITRTEVALIDAEAE